MLPAYNTSTWYTIYFIFYVAFGVFFLMNVLLAVIFDNYKRRIGWTSETRSRERMKYINQFFDEYDEGNKGWLTLHEAKDFFVYVLSFDYHDKEDR